MIPVCVFAKPFEPGKVKTRLIDALGGEGATALARAMFLDVWEAVSACTGVRPVLATVSEGRFPVSIAPENIWLQGEGDLGARLETVLRQGLEDSRAAIAVGADSPALTVAHLCMAMKALEDHDAVLGRSFDGGFYLLGLRQCREGLLAQLPWSTCETAEATIRRLGNEGLSVQEISPLFDVDTPSDLNITFDYLRANPLAAPATRAWCIEKAFLKG